MWEKELEVAGWAAREAGKVLMQFFGRLNGVSKKGEIDLVTEADVRAEEILIDLIGRSFPGDNILAEESGRHSRVSDRVWIIDPLDGTTNFAHSFPFFAVSIALEVGGEITLGIVFNPFTDEYFEAAVKRGASLNRMPIEVSGTDKLGEALLATGFPYTVHQQPQHVLKLFERMLLSAQGIRRPGAASLDLCYVAAGRLDGFWEEGLQPWDTAAGTLILKEAGGRLGTYEGGPYSPYEKTILASNPFIFEEFRRTLNGGV